MPLDAVFLSALRDELSPRLEGARIDKVQQPERDALVLSLRGHRENFKLLIRGGTGNARVQITSQSFENPQSPPMFCMLLRKHIGGARIVSVTQPEFERVLILELESRDEMGLVKNKRLIIEMMGRSSNIILVDDEDRIIDSLRRVDGDMSAKRPVLPGLYYRLPPAPDKPNFFSVGPEGRRELWKAADSEKTADKWLLDSFFGLSPLICRELSYRAFGDATARIAGLDEEEKANLPLALDAFCESVRGAELSPVMLLESGIPKDFSFMKIKQYGTVMELQEYPNFSELLEGFYELRDRTQSIARKSGDMTKSIKTVSDRLRRKLLIQRQELEKSQDRDILRQSGDIIMSNLYRLKKGDRELVAENYYLDPPQEMKIRLDPLKTPQQNGENYYKRYTKAKTAQEHLNRQIKTGEAELQYLESVMDLILRAESDAELGEIRAELVDGGFLRLKSGDKKARKQKKSQPIKFTSASGLTILVGRNNMQNDKLSLKDSQKNDMWLHTQKIHGSHVVIQCADGVLDDETLSQAASLAAYYSQARDSANVPVDYTLVRYVKKPRGAMPGMVIYTDYKTMNVTPELNLGST